MMLSTPSATTSRQHKALRSWDAARQTTYAQSGAVPGLHVLLDASGSMWTCEQQLVTAYNTCFLHLKTLLSPLSLYECWLFNEESVKIRHGLLHQSLPLQAGEYTPGGGTLIRPPLGMLLESTTTPGQHILILFTDGRDDHTQPVRYSLADIQRLMAQRQAEGWLCLYLGAYAEGLAQGLDYGFLADNCLVFGKHAYSAAFHTLRRGVQRYVTAREPRQLAQHGVFTKDEQRALLS